MGCLCCGEHIQSSGCFQVCLLYFCWVFSDLPVHACSFQVSQGCVRSWFLSDLYCSLCMLTLSQLAGILGEFGSLWASLAHTCCLLVSQGCVEGISPLHRIRDCIRCLCGSLLSRIYLCVEFLGSSQVCSLPRVVQ